MAAARVGRWRRRRASQTLAAFVTMALGPAGLGAGAGMVPAAALPPAPTFEECWSPLHLAPDDGPPFYAVAGQDLDATPDGRYLAVHVHIPVNDFEAIDGIFRVDTTTGEQVRIDVSHDGSPVVASSSYPSITADGNFVTFVSNAPNLVEGDTNEEVDVFVYDHSTGDLDRVAVGVPGSPQATARPAMTSVDGRYVTFTTFDQLVAGDTDQHADVYVRDRESDTTILASVNSSGFVFTGNSEGASMSSDGSYVAFYGQTGSAPAAFNVYRRDLAAATTELASLDSDQVVAASKVPMSDDGRYIGYSQWDNGTKELFVRDMDTTSVVPSAAEDGDRLQLSSDGAAIGYYADDGQHIVVEKLGGAAHVVLDEAGLPAEGLFSLIGDGSEVLTVENVDALPGSGGFTDLHSEGFRMAVDRSGVEKLTTIGGVEPITEIMAGESVEVEIHGFNLTAETTFDFGPGLALADLDLTQDPPTATLVADAEADGGLRPLMVGAASGCITAHVGIFLSDGAPELLIGSGNRIRPGVTQNLSITGRFLTCPCDVAVGGGVTVGTITGGTDTSVTVPITAPSFSDDSVVDISFTNEAGMTTVVDDAIALHTAEGEYTAVTPARILDTRDGTGGPRSPIGQTPRKVQVSGIGGVPTGGKASAVVLNVTVVNPTVGGYMTVWPSGTSQPLASNLNFVAGQIVPNQVTVPLGSDGAVSAFVSNGSANVLMDVVGYYATDAGTPGGRFIAWQPIRLLDTRTGPTAFTPGEVRSISHELFGNPAAVVVLNVTVTSPSHAGWLTVAPSGPVPLASNLNFTPGQTVANLVTVGIGSDDKINIFNSSGSTHVIVDLVGMYGDATTRTTDAAFRPLTPTRFLDTRTGTGAPQAPLAGGSSLALDVAARLGVPAGASAVAGNLTVTTPSAGGFLTVWPSGGTFPPTSNLNFVAGQTVPNALLMGLGDDGDLGIYNSAGQAHVITDISGWFTPEALVGSGA